MYNLKNKVYIYLFPINRVRSSSIGKQTNKTIIQELYICTMRLKNTNKTNLTSSTWSSSSAHPSTPRGLCCVSSPSRTPGNNQQIKTFYSFRLAARPAGWRWNCLHTASRAFRLFVFLQEVACNVKSHPDGWTRLVKQLRPRDATHTHSEIVTMPTTGCWWQCRRGAHAHLSRLHYIASWRARHNVMFACTKEPQTCIYKQSAHVVATPNNTVDARRVATLCVCVCLFGLVKCLLTQAYMWIHFRSFPRSWRADISTVLYMCTHMIPRGRTFVFFYVREWMGNGCATICYAAYVCCLCICSRTWAEYGGRNTIYLRIWLPYISQNVYAFRVSAIFCVCVCVFLLRYASRLDWQNDTRARASPLCADIFRKAKP